MLSCWMITLSLVMIIFCHRKIEIIEGYLNDCRCISDARSMWGNGIIGRQMRMNMVTVVLTFPHLMYHNKRKPESTEEFENLGTLAIRQLDYPICMHDRALSFHRIAAKEVVRMETGHFLSMERRIGAVIVDL
jgi:hypothetical protein